MSPARYWLSASVLTITSAPSFSEASRPAWNAAARPLLFVSRTMWSTPPRARHLDRGVGRAVVDDQPLDLVEALDAPRQVGERARAASPPRSRQGIWMISFIGGVEAWYPRGTGAEQLGYSP